MHRKTGSYQYHVITSAQPTLYVLVDKLTAILYKVQTPNQRRDQRHYI